MFDKNLGCDLDQKLILPWKQFLVIKNWFLTLKLLDKMMLISKVSSVKPWCDFDLQKSTHHPNPVFKASQKTTKSFFQKVAGSPFRHWRALHWPCARSHCDCVSSEQQHLSRVFARWNLPPRARRARRTRKSSRLLRSRLGCPQKLLGFFAIFFQPFCWGEKGS